MIYTACNGEVWRKFIFLFEFQFYHFCLFDILMVTESQKESSVLLGLFIVYVHFYDFKVCVPRHKMFC